MEVVLGPLACVASWGLLPWCCLHLSGVTYVMDVGVLWRVNCIVILLVDTLWKGARLGSQH
jgi:hypothetical protein